MTGPIAAVAIPSPLRRHFDYLVPPDLERTAVRGCRVLVPFGRTQYVGVVLRRHAEASVARAKLRPIAALLDDEPTLDEAILSLLEWSAQYYHHPVGEVVQSALPTLLRRVDGSQAQSGGPKFWFLTDVGNACDPETLASAPRQAKALTRLAAEPGLTRAALEADEPGTGAALAALARKGLVESQQLGEVIPPATPAPGPALTDAQAEAVEAIAAAPGFASFLLDGVTGSGKTEVYLHAASAALVRGRQVLVLVPEIGLTPQMIHRFGKRLGQAMVALHSALPNGARRNAWIAARSGQARVVLGTRSTIVTPMPELGLIIVDEEHDLSYKQQDGWRYSARDVAVMRARRADVPVVLGSATPSMESVFNVLAGRSTLLRLPERAGAAALPQVSIVDVRARALDGHLSGQLIEAISETLAAGEQVLLFVNRRGFAPTLLCHECGEVLECPRCDARLVLHRQANRLRCHHCGHETRVPSACKHCDSPELRPVGLGTERLEDELEKRFPGARIDRIDRDTTRRRGALEQSLADARSGQTQILVGTQMLAKGHDFPGVTLVGIVDADGGLFSTDFRASERLAQLIVQVSGRAGRASRPGRVFLQTHQPEHPLLRSLVGGDYAEFARAALAEREAAALPPYGALALLRAEAPRRAACTAFLEEAGHIARDTSPQVAVLGPVPAPMERRQGRFREQLLLSAMDRVDLQRMLRPWAPALEGLASARRVRWSLDVDPQDMS